MADTAIFLTTAQEERLALYGAFRAMGFDEVAALELAKADADPSDAARLLERRCPRQLVVRILA